MHRNLITIFPMPKHHKAKIHSYDFNINISIVEAFLLTLIYSCYYLNSNNCFCINIEFLLE